jgi:hypothetical protein
MKSIVNTLLGGAAGLAIVAVPLAASAQNWHGHDGDNRGAYHASDNRGRDVQRGGYVRGNDRYRVGYEQPVYQQPYVNGYFGYAPGGFQGYYNNGGWYQHRRWNGGVWIYF